jgi:hypothetical protein
MKASLDRTAVLSKDISEQPEGKFVVMLPELSLTLSADSVTVNATDVTVYSKGWAIAVFPPSTTWVAVDRDRVEMITRENQIKRMINNQKAEEALALDLMPDLAEEIGKKRKDNGNGTKLHTGLYA